MSNAIRVVSAMAVCVLALMMAPQGFAQIGMPPPPLEGTVVGASVPSVDQSSGLGIACGPNVLGSEICGQQFSVGPSGAYINRLDLVLAPLCGSLSCPTVPFTVLITDHVFQDPTTGKISFNDIFLERNESITFSGGTVCCGATPFTDAFNPILLPPGLYYLVITSASMEGVGWMCGGPSPGFIAPPTLVGTVESAFDWYSPKVDNAFMEPLPAGTACAFDLEGPLTMVPTGGSKFERVRLVAGPVTPPAGGPVEAQVGFVNAATGALLGPLTPITIQSGQTQLQSVDLDLTPLVARVGQRIEVQPVIVQSPNAAGDVNPGPIQLSATVQVLDELTGFQAVSAPVPQPGAAVGKEPGPAGVSAFNPQILAGGQTMRVDVVASPFDACVGQVSFYDGNDVALLPAVQVNLTPGTGTTVDLNADALNFRIGQEIEVQPVLTLSAPAAAAPQNSVCNASVEVFDHFTGRSWSHQDAMVGLPAVQTPAGSTPGTLGVTTSAGGTQ